VDRLQNLTVTEPPQPPPQSWGTPPPPQPTWSQQHAAPGYGQPSGQPPGQPYGGAGSKLPWVLGGVAALVLLVVVGLVMLLRGSDADTFDPQAAASSFVAAAKDGDCDAFTAVTSQHFQDAYGRCQGDVNTAGFLGATGVVIDDEISITDQTPSSATAELQVSAAGFDVPVQLLLVLEGGRWFVDDVSVAGFNPNDLESLAPGGLPS